MTTVVPPPVGLGDRRFRADVQGLRGVAVLLVVLFHTNGLVPGGFIGVDVFFVISGYVITKSLVRSALRDGRVDLRAFYRRRVRRLLPALSVLLLSVLLLSAVLTSPYGLQGYVMRTGTAAALSVSNVFLYVAGGGYFSPVDELNPFTHTWSLGVEEQFYLGFPLLVLLVQRARRSSATGWTTTWLAGAIVAISTLSLLLSVLLVDTSGGLADLVPQAQRFAFYLPITRIWQFGAGILVALWSLEDRLGRLSSMAGVAGAALVLAASFTLDGGSAYPGLASVAPTLGAALVVMSPVGPVAGLLRVRPLVWLGDLSYSWYLWHWPIIVLVRLQTGSEAWSVAAAALSLLPAIASYRFVEERFRSAPKGSPRGTVGRIVAVGLLPGAVGALFVLGVLDPRPMLPEHPEFDSDSVATDAGCLAVIDLERCRFGDTDSPSATIALVGDSHAASISGAVVAAAERIGAEVVFAGAPGCPVVLVDDPDCQRIREQILAEITAEDPDLVVVANRSTINVLRIEQQRSEVGEIHPGRPATIEQWAMRYGETVEVLLGLSPDVLVVLEPMQLRPEQFEGALPTLAGPDGRNPSADDPELVEARARVVERELDTFAQLDGVTVFDPLPHLCPEGECSLRRDGSFLLRDTHHLTPAAQVPLTTPLGDTIRGLLGS